MYVLKYQKDTRLSLLRSGTDKDHVHFVFQGVPTNSPTKMIPSVKSITAKEIFMRHPEVQRQLWGGEFWSKGFYVNAAGRHGDENTTKEHVKSPGRETEYKRLHSQHLLFF